MSRIKAVIFDMDGVLIDARDWHYEALNRALGLFGYAISRFDHLSTYDGLPTRRKLEMLTIERGLPQPLHDFINELKQQYTMELIHANCKPTFQHEYCLANLKADGYKVGVASNSVRATVEIMMEKAALVPYLDTMVSNEDVTHPKPHPEIYDLALSRLGVPPSEAVVIEDNAHGIASAESAGTHVQAVSSPVDVTWQRIRSAIDSAERQGTTA